jgi:serine-type D-Ala-D-Ala carboxypeptidase/endopeptidase
MRPFLYITASARMAPYWFTSWIWATGLLMGLAGAVRADDVQKVEVDKIVEPFLKDKPYDILAVAIISPKGDSFFGYGKATIDGGEQTPDARTVYEIGSITKSFTGTLLADLVLARKVQLDDPAQKYLPDTLKLPRRDDRDITLLHLATHTSSLPAQPTDLAFAFLTGPKVDVDNPYKHYTPERLSKMLKKLALKRPIGSKADYSNLGVGILGHALAGAAKADSFEHALSERILGPLHMDDTRVTLTDSMKKRLAPGHNKEGKVVSGWDFTCLEACGGLRSTAADMARYAKAALGAGGPLKSAFALAQQPWRERDKDSFTGLCWVRDEPAEGPKVVWHNGGTGGYRSYLGLMPQRGCAVVVLSNANHSVDAVGLAILKSLDSEK